MNIKSNKYQAGMASIMFAIFIAVVISLLAIGFAVLVRNDQRQTLDKKLSNQAQYAAESAINQIQREFQTMIAAGTTIPASPTTCNPTPTVLDIRMPDVKITCLTWDPNPGELTYTGVSINDPKITKIQPYDNSQNIQSLRIHWSKSGATPGSVTIPGGAFSQLAPSMAAGNFPILRITMAKVDNIMGAVTAFLVPGNTNINGNLKVSMANNSGRIGPANCSLSECEAIIFDFPGGLWNNSGNRGWLSVSSINGSSDVTITGYANPNGTGGAGGGGIVEFTGSQAKVDATAMAQDVIKRIQATIPLEEVKWHPGFAAMADKLCKNYAVNGNIMGNDDTYAGMVRNSSSDLCPDTNP